MSRLADKKVYLKDPSMVSRQIANELVLVPISRKTADIENIYTMNEVGARIWELIDGEKSVHEIRDTIAAEFEVSPEKAEEDLLEFIRQLENIGAVRTA